jgi:hypothetical protein
VDEYALPKPKGPVPAKAGADPKADAASDLLAAIKAGDAKAVSLALTRHYEACAGGDDEEAEEV